MAQTKPSFNVEISDIFDEDQEDLVIEKVSSYVKKSVEELKEYFQSTDTIEVRRISKDEAESLCRELEGKELAAMEPVTLRARSWRRTRGSAARRRGGHGCRRRGPRLPPAPTPRAASPRTARGAGTGRNSPRPSRTDGLPGGSARAGSTGCRGRRSCACR